MTSNDKATASPSDDIQCWLDIPADEFSRTARQIGGSNEEIEQLAHYYGRHAAGAKKTLK